MPSVDELRRRFAAQPSEKSEPEPEHEPMKVSVDEMMEIISGKPSEPTPSRPVLDPTVPSGISLVTYDVGADECMKNPAFIKGKSTKCYAATVKPQPGAPGGLARTWWPRGPEGHVRVQKDFAPGMVVEFGGDYKDGRKEVRNRIFARLVSRTGNRLNFTPPVHNFNDVPDVKGLKSSEAVVETKPTAHATASEIFVAAMRAMKVVPIHIQVDRDAISGSMKIDLRLHVEHGNAEEFFKAIKLYWPETAASSTMTEHGGFWK
jgi:hypothetical protein